MAGIENRWSMSGEEAREEGEREDPLYYIEIKNNGW